jgi:tRNA threonylcarbamoyladenosine modification (KEOPS) complex  Pcc1 subunit
MKAEATVRLKFSSEKRLKMFIDALSPEANEPVVGRSKVLLERDGAFLVLKVEAEDAVALRSTLNAYLRWVNSMANVVEVLEETSQASCI